MKLWNYLKDSMLSHPNQMICENNASLSFEELVIWAEQFAKKLKLRGLRCCAILCQSEMATAMALLSCFAADVTAVPLSMRYDKIHCSKIFDTISPMQSLRMRVVKLRSAKFPKANTFFPKHPLLLSCAPPEPRESPKVQCSVKIISSQM